MYNTFGQSCGKYVSVNQPSKTVELIDLTGGEIMNEVYTGNYGRQKKKSFAEVFGTNDFVGASKSCDTKKISIAKTDTDEDDPGKLEDSIDDGPVEDWPLQQCPYNTDHMVRPGRFGRHVFKCRKTCLIEVSEKYSICPNNALHHVLTTKLEEHMKLCNDKGTLLTYDCTPLIEKPCQMNDEEDSTTKRENDDLIAHW